MKAPILTILLLAGCSEAADDTAASRNEPAPATLPATAGTQSKAALMLPLPDDRAQLDRLLAMGYQAHDDHLHAPGVTACPKMAENPVM